MNINFNYNNHPETQALTAVTEQKLGSLKKFIGTDQSVVCDAEFDKVAANQKGSIFRFAVNLQIEGELYRAEATEESFEAAVDEVRAELDKRLRRNKSKKDSLGKRAGRAMKRLIGRQS
jgi:ribosomal subunit interface protein